MTAGPVVVRPTISDVADRAGVSRQTVSRVLHGGHRVATRTHARVTAAIDELGYRPDPAAQALGERRSRGAPLRSDDGATTAAPAEVAAIVAAFREVGLPVVLARHDDPPEFLASCTRLAADRGGVVVVAP